MKESPRSRETAGDTRPTTPHRRLSSALAHNSAGAASPGNPRRSVGRPSQTPRDERYGDRPGRLGALPPAPRRPISVLLTVIALGFALFALVTWQVASHGPLFRWDTGTDAAVLRDGSRYRLLTPAAQFLADLGDIAVAVPPLALVLAYAAWRHRRAGRGRWWLPSAVCAAAMALTGPVVVPLKALVSRPAPGTTTLAGHSGYFPSGHAATAAMASGLAVLLLLPLVQRAAARRLLVIAAVLLNAAVDASLVWRGYHWPLDVVASWCLSAVLLGLTRWWGSPG